MSLRSNVWGVAACIFIVFGCSTAEEPIEDLFTAVRRGSAPAIEQLVTDGADLNVAGDEGDTPLHLAVEIKNQEAARMLIAQGADPKLRNMKGFSSFFLASVVHQDAAMTAILMGMDDNSASAEPFPDVSFGSLQPPPQEFADPASLVLWNPRFRYRFRASPDWNVFRVQQDGALENRSIVVLGLPPTWSELAGKEIDNAVSLYTKEDESLTSLEAAVEALKRRLPPTVTYRIVDSDVEGSVTLDYDQLDHGLVYRKRTVVQFREGIMYQLEFTATRGTFDTNLPLFSAFARGLEILPSK